jgi:hypothetical protein
VYYSAILARMIIVISNLAGLPTGTFKMSLRVARSRLAYTVQACLAKTSTL